MKKKKKMCVVRKIVSLKQEVLQEEDDKGFLCVVGSFFPFLKPVQLSCVSYVRASILLAESSTCWPMIGCLPSDISAVRGRLCDDWPIGCSTAGQARPRTSKVLTSHQGMP